MLEPPSQELVRQLTELQLCHPSDLRRARSRVKRLAYDLPAFDSVWIDSLVQLRLLTPYQARRLEEGQADQLRIGTLVVIDQLSQSDRGATLLARRLNRRDRYVVKRQRVPADRLAEITTKMQQTLDRANRFAHPNVVLPFEIIPSPANELITVSRLVPGLPLNELLVRRGRFPAEIVLDIGRQLLEGLAALHGRTLIHGDIRMSHVRLTDHGLAVLVDGALRPVVYPEMTIHDQLALEAYDGLAPELIGTGAAATMSSDLYALGCLLWQLLAGRAPFICADPLTKIAAHQTQTIADVRTLAPETPPLLADLISQMTSPSPNQRPRGAAEVLQRWGRAGSFSRSRLKQFRQLFDAAAPHFTPSVVRSGQSHWVWLFAMIVVAFGGVAMFYDPKLRAELLDIAHNIQFLAREARDAAASRQNQSGPNDGSAAQGQITRGQKSLRPLPKPNADGVVLLTERGPYSASELTFAGNLTIRGLNGAGSEIIVDDEPLTLTAQAVNLDHVTLRCEKGARSAFLAKVSCQQLQINHCDLATNQGDADDNTAGTMGLAWKPVDRDPKLSLIRVNNSVFRGAGPAILLAQPTRLIQISNTLKSGPGTMLALGPKSSASDCRVELDRVTLRQAGPLLRLAGESAQKVGIAPIQLQASHCVIDLADPRGGLILADSDRPRPDLSKAVELKAVESFITPGASLLVAFDASRNQSREIDADEQFDGLEVGEIQFSGNRLDRISDSRATGLKGPRQASKSDLPGIEPRQVGPAVRTTTATPE